MIDPTDKQTQNLPLDSTPVKRGRGRPSTGKAMTPAEKQRAYRERMKNEGRERYLERQITELREKLEDYMEIFERKIKETEEELKEAKETIYQEQKMNLELINQLEKTKGNVTGIELTDAEATAIISLLGDKAREISMRSEEPINPRQRESINWLVELSKKIAREIKK